MPLNEETKSRQTHWKLNKIVVSLILNEIDFLY